MLYFTSLRDDRRPQLSSELLSWVELGSRVVAQHCKVSCIMLFRAVSKKSSNTIQRIPLLGGVQSSPITMLPTELWRIVFQYLFRCQKFYGDYYELEQDYSILLKLMPLCRWAVDSKDAFVNFRRLKALHGTSCLQEYTFGYNKDA